MADIQAKRDAKIAEKEEERRYAFCAQVLPLPPVQLSWQLQYARESFVQPLCTALVCGLMDMPVHLACLLSLPVARSLSLLFVRVLLPVFVDVCVCLCRARNEAIKKEKQAKAAARAEEKSAKEKAEEERLRQQQETAAKREAKIAEKEEERKRRAEENAGKKKDAGQSKYSKKDVMELKVLRSRCRPACTGFFYRCPPAQRRWVLG